MFQKGDRVRCIKAYMSGVQPSDTGTVVGVGYDLVKVRWDTYRASRHDCGGLCEPGFGWNVPITCVEPEPLNVDYGELPILDIANLL